MARPTRLNKALIEAICAPIKDGAHRRFAAAQAGVDESQLSRWFHRGAGEDSGIFRELFLAVNNAEAEFEQAARTLLKSGAAHDPKLALQWLGRRFPDLYGRRDNVERENPEDRAQQAQQTRDLLMERLEKLFPEAPEAAEPPGAVPDAE